MFSVEEKGDTIREIERHIENEDLEKTSQTLEEIPRHAAEPRKIRKSEKWFDKECYMPRKDLLATLHDLKSRR